MIQGQELDRFMAERVMKWKVQVEHGIVCIASGPRIDWEVGRIGHSGWSPSTKIEHAFEVVEEMRTRGFAFDSYSSGSKEVGHPWSDAIFLGTDARESHARELSLPHAICVAAMGVALIWREE